MRLLITILLLLTTYIGYSQTYNYTYTDPCDGTLQTIVVPVNGEVTVGYYGFVETFNSNDFSNGNFEAWAQNVFTQFDGNSPCSQIVGVGTVVSVSQGTAFNVIGILNSLTAISDLASATTGATNMLGGTVGSASNASNGDSEEESNNNENNGTSNTTEGGATTSGSNEASSSNGGTGSTNQNGGAENSTQAGGASTQGGSNENGNSQTNTSVTNTNENGTNNSSNNPDPAVSNGSSGSSNGGEAEPVPPGQTETSSTESGNSTETTTVSGEGSNGSNSSGNQGEGSGGNETQQESPGEEAGATEEEGKSNVTGGATTTTKNAPSKSEGGKPTVVASSDFVGFNFRNSEVKTGLKATGGYTALRWDGQRSWGALVDYTSALKGPNATTFYAWIRPKSVALLSTTLTVGFVGNKSLYGTIAGGQMFSFAKVPKLKAVYMGTVSYGQIQREQFLGTAVIGGVMYDFKIGKKIDIKLMDLLVYVPYVSYYNDLVLQSPWVMLPSIGTNIGISKRFKFNINAGGAWDLKTSALNYTITCGTRMLVGQ